ncbi:hypothetical protein CGCF415_v004149 [Colletotrichum fructicola]|uniref:Uncharacterized protein n=1 Tax=Colletotrichum fructicola (strain Nara gc5) TaxID=1213859 RepID=L2FJF4_COLFN|nr:hypothetical protein CGGC5_v002921 [Colletotrichum fructicola Nara gc5]KAF4892522.1 hypothetical protein CGCFRS4_v007514 [Colletotrichum fructicola]KAF4912017.1 hypothetical protein CGCF415_v004149 [Colletotrichum fructicola]KAF5504801.1 hypothetical protein CGCF413_v005822 [Colletotrichum fructicola]
MATLVRLPLELTNMVAAYLTSAKDFLSWISVDPEILQKLLENKSAVFESFVDRDLLPPTLAVLRLREIHQQSSELPSIQDLVISAFKLKAAAEESTPDLVWPTDKASALALLELMDEVECIVTAMQNYRYRDDSFWPETPWLHEHPEHSKRPEGLDFTLYDERTTRLLQHDSFWDKKDEHSMFVQKKLVLLFEIYVLCFCYGREFPDHTSDQTPFEILSMTTEDTSTQIDIRAVDFGEQIDKLASCLSRTCDSIIDSALRQVLNIRQVDAQPFWGSDVVLQEGVQTLKEALGTQKVMFHSARWSYYRKFVTWTRTGIESMTGTEARRLLRPSQVGLIPTGKGRVPIYRIACMDTGEFIVNDGYDGVTVVAYLETLQEQQNWDRMDGIHNAWKLLSGGIGRLAPLLRLDEGERQTEIIGALSRANSKCRSAIEATTSPLQWFQGSLKTWIKDYYPGSHIGVQPWVVAW